MLSLSLSRHGDTDMTSGSIPAHLIRFAIPLLIGNIFQQLYNTVDSIIVGNYVGKEALAAIGCTAPIVNTFINFFTGLSSGAGVVISNYYGAKDPVRLHKAVQTAVTFTLAMCVALTGLGVWLAPQMLKLMATPEDVMPEATAYLTIYFWGVSGLLLYNIGAGVLRAVGDSKRPLYFLIVSALTNTVLDIIFVKYLSWGIEGAAVATILSQFISAVMVMALLGFSREAYHVNLLKPHISFGLFKSICIIGLPTAIQMAITAFSNVFVQSYINRFGSFVMAGWTSYVKLDAFALQPTMSLAVAITTFVGQNLGAKQTDRVQKVPRTGLLIGLSMVIIICIPLMLFAPQIVSLFGDDPEVIKYGAWFLRLISPFYLCFAVNQVFIGMLRGAGDTVITMILLLFSFVASRQIYLYIVYYVLDLGLHAVAYGYPVGWMMCSLLLVIYYYGFGKKKMRLRRA